MNHQSIDLNASVLVACIMRQKMRFIAIFAICFAVLSFAVLVVTPSYEVSSVLIGGQPDLEPITNAVRRSSDSGTSLAGIAESEEVLRTAIAQVGLKKLFGASELETVPIFEQGRAFVLRMGDELNAYCAQILKEKGLSWPFPKPNLQQESEPKSQADVALAIVGRSLKVKSEANSDIIRISFRHRDPVVAATFVNAVSQAFIDRQAAIFSKTGASEFFQEQSSRFSKEFQKASDEFRDFMISSGVYSTGEQRQLLLRRRNDVATSLALSRGNLTEKSAQKTAIVGQLRKLAPVARSPYVSSVVNSLSNEKPEKAVGEGSPILELPNNEAPLLLVKVYQDSMANLFRIDADLLGAERARETQVAELEAINRDLARLAANEYKFSTLRNAVNIAEENKALYEKRMIEEKINAESRAAKFLAVKVVQKAFPTTNPVFPNYGLATAIAFIMSILAGVFAAARAGLRQIRNHQRLDGGRAMTSSLVTA